LLTRPTPPKFNVNKTGLILIPIAGVGRVYLDLLLLTNILANPPLHSVKPVGAGSTKSDKSDK